MPYDIRHSTAANGARGASAPSWDEQGAADSSSSYNKVLYLDPEHDTSPYAVQRPARRKPQPKADRKPAVSAAAHARVNERSRREQARSAERASKAQASRDQLRVIPGKPTARRRPNPDDLPVPEKPAARRRSKRERFQRIVRSETTWRVVAMATTAVFTVGLTVAMLFSPAETLYLSMRENERLADELQRNLDRNEQMQERITSLQTVEGIQDEARRTLGLVLPDDNAVSVTGIDYEPASTAIPAEVSRGSGTNTRSWATDLLDSVFAVDASSVDEGATDVVTITEDVVETAEDGGEPTL